MACCSMGPMFLSSKPVSDASDTLPGDGPNVDQTDPLGRTLPGLDAPAESSPDEQALPELPPVAQLPSEAAAHLKDVELDLNLDLDFNLDGPDTTDMPLLHNPLAQPSVGTSVTDLYGVPEMFHEDLAAESEDHHRALDLLSPTLSLQTTQLLMTSRVLVVSADAGERMYLRARLALAQLVLVDEAGSNAEAFDAMDGPRHVMAIVNLDDPSIDAQAVATRFRQTNAKATLVATVAAHGLPGLALAARWRRLVLQRRLAKAGFSELLDNPLDPKKLVSLFNKVVLNK